MLTRGSGRGGLGRTGLRIRDGNQRRGAAQPEIQAESSGGQNGAKGVTQLSTADTAVFGGLIQGQGIVRQAGFQFHLGGLELRFRDHAVAAVGLDFLHLVTVNGNVDVASRGLACRVARAQQRGQHEGQGKGDADDVAIQNRETVQNGFIFLPKVERRRRAFFRPPGRLAQHGDAAASSPRRRRRCPGTAPGRARAARSPA